MTHLPDGAAHCVTTTPLDFDRVAVAPDGDITAPSYTERVRELLLCGRPRQHLGMRTVSQLFGISERTLRRHLVAEGTSFATIVSDSLSSVASRYLIEERRSIQETARDLGFADKASFHRAFKRWTGMTPKTFCRRQALASNPSLTPSPSAESHA